MAGIPTQEERELREAIKRGWGHDWQQVLADELGTHRTYIVKMVRGYPEARNGETWQRFLRLVGPDVEAMLLATEGTEKARSTPRDCEVAA